MQPFFLQLFLNYLFLLSYNSIGFTSFFPFTRKKLSVRADTMKGLVSVEDCDLLLLD